MHQNFKFQSDSINTVSPTVVSDVINFALNSNLILLIRFGEICGHYQRKRL